MAAQTPKLRDYFLPPNSPIRQMFESLFPDKEKTRQFEQAVAQIDFNLEPAGPIEVSPALDLPEDAIPNGYRRWQEDEHKQYLEAFGKEWLELYAPGVYLELDEKALQSLEVYRNNQNLDSTDEALRHWLGKLPAAVQKLTEHDKCWAGLTPREKEVTALYCLGLSIEQIVDVLPDVTSASTIKSHLTSARGKFGLHRIDHLRHVLGDKDFSEYDKYYSK